MVKDNSITRVIVAFLAITLVSSSFTAFSSPVFANGVDDNPSENKVIVCHDDDNVLVIGTKALASHLGHGDTEGACEEEIEEEPGPNSDPIAQNDEISTTEDSMITYNV